MKIERLSWAGIRLETSRAVALIDPLGDVSKLEKLGLGPPHTGIVQACGDSPVNAVFITHLHPDHYDPGLLKSCLNSDGIVFCAPETADRIASDGLRAQPIHLYEAVEFEDLKATPVPAVDGLGDPQVSWVVEDERVRIIHCGDTLWHGYWLQIVKACGPIDIAFLPINGPQVEFEGLPSSGIPAALTPAQAVAAGVLLGARHACPIHYGMFNNPPIYTEHPDALDNFILAASERKLEALVVEPGFVV